MIQILCSTLSLSERPSWLLPLLVLDTIVLQPCKCLDCLPPFFMLITFSPGWCRSTSLTTSGDGEKKTQDINCNFLLDLTNKPAIMKISKIFILIKPLFSSPPPRTGAFYSNSLFLLLKAIFSIDLSLTKQL